ncbi:GNAT family N-acetyltransferase [Hyunsoonleella ulvae]|uniref:GNAT family N-acetyltransferase n=1 Tax=Hyunsoonleella ulvae TaxID=2799948 RepID=UPI00193A685C|nr:GNAT family N-acetyltransferase [Hyunsoonleella ulvae]
MITFTKATNNQHFATIETLANTIWQQHYTPIIGEAQVIYMLNKFQSAHSIKQQTIDGFQYFILKKDNIEVGYISIKKDRKTLFLSKIYVLKTFRGKGIGKSAMQFLEAKAKVFDCDSVTLTVNKNNVNTIQAYESMGFKILEAICIDIGNGFMMDDYRMMKIID